MNVTSKAQRELDAAAKAAAKTPEELLTVLATINVRRALAGETILINPASPGGPHIVTCSEFESELKKRGFSTPRFFDEKRRWMKSAADKVLPKFQKEFKAAIKHRSKRSPLEGGTA